MVHPRVFLDFSVDSSPVGRVIFELFNVSAPKSAENFRALCTGERGVSPKSQMPLYYKHSKVHRVIQDFMIQGGDFTKGNGTGGESIYGGPFVDEDLSRPVDEPGLLCMANKGPNTNNSQFFITLCPCTHLTGKHVVFGRVIRGFEDVVRRIAAVSTDEKDRPTVPVEIINCGELQLVKRPAVPAKESEKRDKEGSVGRSDSEREEERGRKRRKHQYSSSHSRSPSQLRSRPPSRSVSKPRPRSHPPTPISGDSKSEAERKHRKNKKKHHHKDKKEKKEKKDKKRHKSHKRRSASHSLSRSRSRDSGYATPNGDPDPDSKPNPNHRPQETEQEYDARLEREERERIEAARRRELAEVKKRYGAERQAKSLKDAEIRGVRFKGRGRMKYVDPELHSRRD